MSRIEDNPGKPGTSEPAEAAVEAGEARLVARAREVLLESVDSLDGRTRSQLTQARHAALAQLAGARPATLVRWLVPAGGLAAVALVAVLWFGGAGNSLPVTDQSGLVAGLEGSPLDDMAIMADADSLELLEDIEFYAWLDDEAELLPVGGVG